MAELKEEYRVREELIYSKQKHPQALFHKNNKADFVGHLGEGTIALSLLPEYKYLQNVVELLDDEQQALSMGVSLGAYKEHKAALRAAAVEAAAEQKLERDAERALQKQHAQEQLARQQQEQQQRILQMEAAVREQERAKAFREMQIIEQQALHTVPLQCHGCLVAPTEKLFNGTKSRRAHRRLMCNAPYPTKCIQKESGYRDQNSEQLKFSCEKCDFDICLQCFEFDKLGPEARAKVLAADQKQKEKEAKELAERREKERKAYEKEQEKEREAYEKRQEKEREAYEKEQEKEKRKQVRGYFEGCKKLALMIKKRYDISVAELALHPNKDNLNLQTPKKFVVYQASIDSHKGYKDPEERLFESSWNTLKQANARACLVFHAWLQMNKEHWNWGYRAQDEWNSDDSGDSYTNRFTLSLEQGRAEFDKRGHIKLIFDGFGNDGYGMAEYRCGAVPLAVFESFENVHERKTADLLGLYFRKEDWSEKRDEEEEEEDGEGREDAAYEAAISGTLDAYHDDYGMKGVPVVYSYPNVPSVPSLYRDPMRKVPSVPSLYRDPMSEEREPRYT